MSIKTHEELGETSERESPTPAGKTTRVRSEKSENGATADVATKARRTTVEKAVKKSVAAKKSGSQTSRRKTAGIPEEAQEDAALSKGAIENELNGDAAGSSGNAVKPLTEAGKKRLVNKLLGLADSQATLGAFKITPADLIRLMQLHREMYPQKGHKVTVQWIEDEPK